MIEGISKIVGRSLTMFQILPYEKDNFEEIKQLRNV